MKKNQLIIVLAIIVLIFIFVVVLSFFLKDKSPKEEVIPEELATAEDFLGSPIITGSFVEMDIKSNTLYLETYDTDQRQDIIFSVEITDKTIFRKSSQQENSLALKDYSEALDFLYQGTPLKVFVQDPLKERPEAFVVEIDADFPRFFQPAEVEPL